MWHEARKQEKKIRKVIVDYRKRSERRHAYYERIKQDPTKFLQVHGRKYKIHLDGNVAAEADNNNHMMLWQGDGVTMIDRFDVRAHLDYYNDVPKAKDETVFNDEERKCNFERYRVLIWNTHKNVSELQHLRQIYIEEQFPDIAAKQKQRQDTEMQKQMLSQSKTSIGYDYEENVGLDKSASSNFIRGQDGDDTSDSEDELDILRELEEIPPLTDMNMETITQLDEIGVKKFGLRPGGFGDCLLDDQDNMDKMDEAKALEHEKQKFSGRKSRRERRLLKDERLRGREIGQLSFVRKDTSEGDSDSSPSESESDSSDSSEEKDSEKIQYITSFGDDTTNKSETSSDLSCQGKSAKATHDKSPNRYKPRRSRSPESSLWYKSSRHRSRRSRSRSRSRSRHDRSSRHHSRHSRSRSPHSDRYRRRSSSSERYSRSNRSRSNERRSRSGSAEPKSCDDVHRSKGVTAVISSTSHKTSSLTASKLSSSENKNSLAKKLTPQQKLKIRMQRALNKQLKADRHADSEKRMQKYQEQMDREDNLREMARRLRRRERDEED